MPASYLPYQPDQDFLLPPSMREWLPEGHLAYFISDTVDTLDLSAFAGGGFDASYNAQTAVDEAAHIVVAAELTNVGSDAAELPRMLAAIKEQLGAGTAAGSRRYRLPLRSGVRATGQWRDGDASSTCRDSGNSACEGCTGCKRSGSSFAWR
jgi:hypothetical protein